MTVAVEEIDDLTLEVDSFLNCLLLFAQYPHALSALAWRSMQDSNQLIVGPTSSQPVDAGDAQTSAGDAV